MPTFNGKFQYRNPAGGEQKGPCRVVFDGLNLQLILESGSPLCFDLGDIDEFVPGDYQLSLKIYDGGLIVLSQFGKAFQNLAHDLLEAYRERTIQCFLLEDLEEVTRVDGFVQLDSAERNFSGRSEIRLYESNVAILPEAAAGLQWRLADIDTFTFDEAAYALNLRAGNDRLILSKLAKRTGEFQGCLKSSMNDLAEKAAKVIRQLFPFLTPDQFQRTALLLKEGRAVRVAELESVHPKAGEALMQQTVDSKLRPYFDFLHQHAAEKSVYAGFKLIRKETEEDISTGTPEGPESADEPEPDAVDQQDETPSVLHWYFFPLRDAQGRNRNVVAWEAVSASGRATYFFRLVPKKDEPILQDPLKAREALDSSVRALNQALVLLNFRREPVYLPDESLELQPRYRRYAIACRRMPVLRCLRASFLGRALHSSPQDWQQQVEKVLSSTD